MKSALWRHHVAVVRVELTDDGSGGLLIHLLEIQPGRHGDRTLGVVRDPATACSLLGSWMGRVRDAALTPDRRPRGEAVEGSRDHTARNTDDRPT